MAEAILNGRLTDDGGLPCEIRFQYGLTPAMGTFTPWLAGSFRSADLFWQRITALPGNRNHYFRAEARNADGNIAVGSILSFITTRAVIEADIDVLDPINITAHSARLRGIVNVGGNRPGQVRFHYGAGRDYGMVTPWQYGFVAGDEFYADIFGLSEGSAYHFRAELETSPQIYSKDLSFSTLAEIGGITLVDDELLRRVGVF